jgi:hypothetical protein
MALRSARLCGAASTESRIWRRRLGLSSPLVAQSQAHLIPFSVSVPWASATQAIQNLDSRPGEPRLNLSACDKQTRHRPGNRHGEAGVAGGEGGVVLGAIEAWETRDEDVGGLVALS